MKNILVTGGAGCVGMVLVPMLLKENYNVVVLDNLYAGIKPSAYLLDSNFRFINGDIQNIKTLQMVLRDVDLVVHLAAVVGYQACDRNTKLAEDVNLNGTIILNQLREIDQSIIFASTDSVYGFGEYNVDEETLPNPSSLYSRTKAKAEKHLLKAGNVVVYRFSSSFGVSPRFRYDLLINDFVYQAFKKKYLLIYEKDFRRSFIHVQDMAKAIIFAIQNISNMTNQIYNVGSKDLSFTKEEIANLLKNKLDFQLVFAEVDSDPEYRNHKINFTRLRNLGFEPKISLQEGIDELIETYQLFEGLES